MFPAGHQSLLHLLLDRIARSEGLSKDQLDALKADGPFCRAAVALEAAGWEHTGGMGEQIDMFRRTRSLCPTCLLRVDGRLAQARIGLDELWRFYLPVCRMLRQRVQAAAGARLVVGIAGPPGSGKSVFAAVLSRLMEAFQEDAEPGAVVIGLDGFHYANEHLDNHHRAIPGLQPELLRTVKGAPETFDVETFVSALDALRSEPQLDLPAYDRVLHDPVAGSVHVEEAHRLALVEGNYLLLDENGWEQVRPRLDLRLFISIPLEAIRPHIIERHVRGGRSADDAERHFERVDRRNYEFCIPTMQRADVVIERGADQHIRTVRGPHR